MNYKESKGEDGVREIEGRRKELIDGWNEMVRTKYCEKIEKGDKEYIGSLEKWEERRERLESSRKNYV